MKVTGSLQVAQHGLIVRADRRDVWPVLPVLPGARVRLDPPGVDLDPGAIYDRAAVP